MVNPLFEFDKPDKLLEGTFLLIKFNNDNFRMSYIYYGNILQGLRKTIYIKQNDEVYLTIKRIYKQIKELIISR